RLWREKRGEAEPEDLSGNLIVQLGRATEELNRSWFERSTGRQVRDVQRLVRHSTIFWMAATLDGIVEGTEAGVGRKFMLPWSFSEEAAAEKYMARPAQHVGHPFADFGPLHHYRRRQMGRGRHTNGPALSHRSGLGGKEVLALRPVRRGPAPHHGRAATAAHRGHPHRRHELVELVGGVRSALPQHPGSLSRPRALEERAQGADAGGRQGGDWARGAGQAVEGGRRKLRRPNDGGRPCTGPVNRSLLWPPHWLIPSP